MSSTLPSTTPTSSSSSPAILINRYTYKDSDNDILTLTFNNPSKGNCINKATYTLLGNTINEANKDPRIVIIVLLSTGKFFSTGADLTESPDPNLEAFSIFTQSLIDCTKIVIAGVQGPAIGILCTTLLHCDLVYCTNNASFTVPFARIAVVPEFASSYTFPTLFGKAIASDLMLTGRTLTAHEAVQYGLVSDMIPSSSNTDLLLFIEKKINIMLTPAYAKKSLLLFKEMLKKSTKTLIQDTHNYEKIYLKERLHTSEPMEAALQWMVMKNQTNTNKHTVQSTSTTTIFPKL